VSDSLVPRAVHACSADHPTLLLCQAEGIETTKMSTSAHAYWYPDGTKTTSEEDEAYKAWRQRFKEFYKEERKSGQLDREVSMEDLFQQFVAIAGLTAEQELGTRARLNAKFEQEYGALLRELAGADFDADDDWSDDSDNIVLSEDWKKGYAQVPDALARGVDVRLNAAVTRIEYDLKGVGGVTVTAGGEQYTAKVVISTLPLGYMQAHHRELFSPPLSLVKDAAIHGLGFGILDKVALVFSEPWWAGETPGVNADPDWFDVLPATPPALQVGQIEFANLYQTTGQPVLVAFTAGSIARASESLGEKALTDNVLATLQTIFPDVVVPMPEATFVGRWGLDEWTLGSYSFVPAGGVHGFYADLGEPEGNLLFAGEATTKKYPSTVLGALLTGRKAAADAVALLAKRS